MLIRLICTDIIMDCLFCKILDKKIPALVVYKDDHALAFLDVMPRSPGHTLVVPKTHAATIVDLPDSEVPPLFLAVKKVVELLTRALAPDGVTLGVNQGEASGQMVGHVHVHIMPRFRGDGGSAVQSVVHNPPQESLSAIADKIKNANIKM